MFSSIGERITYCRSILGLSRKDFAKKISVSLTTLTRWELNYIEIPDKRLHGVISFFNDQGLLVEYRWMVEGYGLSPLNTNLKQMKNLNYDELAYSVLNGLKQELKGLEIFQVNNDFFSPIVNFGDYIAGVFIDDLKSIENKSCFILTKDQVYCGVFSFKDFCIKNTRNDIFYLKINEIKIGKLLWMTNRF